MAGLSVEAPVEQPTAAISEALAFNMSGPASFSTNFGACEPQIAWLGRDSMIVHDDDREHCEAHAANLRRRFPEECKKLTDPEIELSNLFDHKDLCVTGLDVLQEAIGIICHENRVRMDAVKAFAENWRGFHPFRAQKWLASGTRDVFKDEEIEEYGGEFLNESLAYLKESYEPVKPLSLCKC